MTRGSAVGDDAIEVDLTFDALDVASLHDRTVRTRIEQVLSEIPGVVAARIVPGDARLIDELHVLATTIKSVKPLVRDIESLLYARFGISLDRRVVSVVQLDADDAPGNGTRAVLSAVTIAQVGLSVEVDVTIDVDDRTLHGASTGPASADGRHRATARATLEAVRPLLGETNAIEVEGVEVADVLGREVAVTLVHFHTPKGDYTVSGSAVVHGDEQDAVARSMLDALNRSIERATATTSGA